MRSLLKCRFSVVALNISFINVTQTTFFSWNRILLVFNSSAYSALSFFKFLTFLLQLLTLLNLYSRNTLIKQVPLKRLARFNNNPSVSIWTNIHRRQSLTNQTSDENRLEMFTQPRRKWFLNFFIQFPTTIMS